MEWRLGDSLGISDRGTKAKTITSCDNAFVTNILLPRDPGASNASEAAHRTPSRNGNQPHVLVKNPKNGIIQIEISSQIVMLI
ncbi:hypothetical protein [Lysinibacillus sp. TE18511]